MACRVSSAVSDMYDRAISWLERALRARLGAQLGTSNWLHFTWPRPRGVRSARPEFIYLSTTLAKCGTPLITFSSPWSSCLVRLRFCRIRYLFLHLKAGVSNFSSQLRDYCDPINRIRAVRLKKIFIRKGWRRRRRRRRRRRKSTF